MTASRGQAAEATPLAGFWGPQLSPVPTDERPTAAGGTPAPDDTSPISLAEADVAEPAAPAARLAAVLRSVQPAQPAPVDEPAAASVVPARVVEPARHAAAAPAVTPPTLLRPATYLCANCDGRFPARTRPTPYCSLQCSAEAKAVRYARKQRGEHGDVLPMTVRILLQRKIMHALTECTFDKWSGQPEPDPVTPPAVHPLASVVDQSIPETDTFALKHQELRARALAATPLLPCDADSWDSAWRTWVNVQAR